MPRHPLVLAQVPTKNNSRSAQTHKYHRNTQKHDIVRTLGRQSGNDANSAKRTSGYTIAPTQKHAIQCRGNRCTSSGRYPGRRGSGRGFLAASAWRAAGIGLAWQVSRKARRTSWIRATERRSRPGTTRSTSITPQKASRYMHAFVQRRILGGLLSSLLSL